MRESISEPSDEPIVTTFGTVSNDRVTFAYRRTWFGGKSLEDIPLRHVTSVSIGTRRHVLGGILCIIVAIIGLAIGKAGMAIGIVFLGLAVLLLWGFPTVRLNTAGGDVRPSIGPPWSRSEAEKFTRVLKERLFAQ